MHVPLLSLYILAAPGIIKDEAASDSDINNNWIVNEDGQEELDSLRTEKICAGKHLANKSQKHHLKVHTSSERILKFQKELRSCISGYRDVHT
ncbi:hypothetical protein TNCV_4181201 [Trichonephila clavipes]|nr:hypothetical protein TNCV_4181201 [Trichonephila clavipes]